MDYKIDNINDLILLSKKNYCERKNAKEREILNKKISEDAIKNKIIFSQIILKEINKSK